MQQRTQTAYECTKCGWQFWNNAKASVAIVFVQDGQILMSERGIEPNKGMLDLPGGFVDFGETAYQAAAREAKEEVGVTIARKDLELLEVYHNPYSAGVFTIDLIFLARHWEGEFTPGDDCAALTWKPFEFINDPQFAEKFYTGLDKILQAKFAKQR